MMRLSTKGRYTLEALVVLGLRCSEGESMSLSSIGREAGLSERYLEHLFRKLKRQNILTSKKGKYGGYCLSRDADKITVGEILVCVEGPLSLVRCSESDSCERKEWCLTHKLWDKAYDRISQTIDSITLHDLVQDYKAKLEKAGAS